RKLATGTIHKESSRFSIAIDIATPSPKKRHNSLTENALRTLPDIRKKLLLIISAWPGANLPKIRKIPQKNRYLPPTSRINRVIVVITRNFKRKM
ncbi:MAG: hypothetical protein ACYS8Z_22580, partial [Planctomycetota bacterium]